MADKLGPLDPYFTNLAKAMVVWIEAWRELNPKKASEELSEAGVAKENGVAKASVTLPNGAGKA